MKVLGYVSRIVDKQAGKKEFMQMISTNRDVGIQIEKFTFFFLFWQEQQKRRKEKIKLCVELNSRKKKEPLNNICNNVMVSVCLF